MLSANAALSKMLSVIISVILEQLLKKKKKKCVAHRPVANDWSLE